MSDQQTPTLEDQYYGVRDALIKLLQVTKDGDQNQIHFWAGAFTRRAAEFARRCLGDSEKGKGITP